MRNILFFFLFLLSCGSYSENPTELYEETMNVKPFTSIFNLCGDGKIVMPEYMSWVLLKYNVNDCFKKDILSYNSFSSKSQFNQAFEKTTNNLFEEEVEHYYKFSKIRIDSTNFKLENCNYYIGINFPFYHQLAFDTLNNVVIHLVGGMKD